ncbi:MAG: 1-acyl-sn-glycerol-3-phosphate acyltransferase [Leptospiraceae bacterium]|nr:1-acyl-sn-glycerol-3-phosphate acyltransferase [Leptospiraceae bacterium]
MAQRRFFQSPDWREFLGKDFEYVFFRGITHAFLDSIRSYTDLQVEGEENVPRHGPVILVPNHSGVLGWDAMVLQNEVLKKIKRMPRTMSHNYWHQDGFFKKASARLAYIPQDFKVAIRVLRKRKLLILFPEAESGNFKSSIEMYRLKPFNPGFVSLAVMTGATIVPVSILGAEETHLNLGTLDWTEKYVGAKIPLPVNLIPLPVQWKICFLKPVTLNGFGRKDAKNIRFLEEAAEIIRMKIQHRINQELVNRGIFKFTLDG